jgi:predicted nuclease of predicted toxin-antitoxin system
VITKDSDFVESFLLQGKPRKLLLVSTGNITNANLEVLFGANLQKVVMGFDTFDFIELNRTSVIFHF